MTIESILLIDDCDTFREIATAHLTDLGYIVWDARCPHDAWPLLDQASFDLILCDLHMPFMTGKRQIEFQTSYQVGLMTIKELIGLFPEIPVIGITDISLTELFKIRMQLKGVQVVNKPFSREGFNDLVQTIEPRSMVDTPVLQSYYDHRAEH